MARPLFPKSLREFQAKFASDEACHQYLADCRWPDGFVCRRHRQAYALAKQRRWHSCRHQVSLTAGTVLHNTKTPLTVWFSAAYLMRGGEDRGQNLNMARSTKAASDQGSSENTADSSTPLNKANEPVTPRQQERMQHCKFGEPRRKQLLIVCSRM